MHKIFQLSSISSIPRPGKDFVLAALDGGAVEMQALLDRILRKKITRVNLPKLFCLFHAVLDTAPIADLLERDITVPVVRADVIQQLARVNLAIDGLDMILSKRVWADGTNAVLPTEALAEFCPRLLAWLEVWHVFAEVLHATPQELPYRLSCDTVQLHLVKMLCRNDAAKRVVFAVEHTRLYWVLGRAWILLPRVVALVPEVDLKNALHTLCWVWDQDYMEFQNGDEHGHKLHALLEGVGGDWETLARLCVFNERTYFPTPDSFVDDGVVTVMRTPITTMIAATPGERTFQNALRRDGMVTYLVNALRSLVAGGQVGRGYRSTDLCLGAIALCLSGPHNEKVFLEAVHSHLIPAAAEYGARLRATADEQEFSESAIRFYHVVLVGYFSTYAVLKALRETPFEEDLLAARDLKFKNKHVEEAWAFFSMFSFTRMMLATEFEKGKLANAPRACDNIACDRKFLEKGTFKCWSACRDMIYCSVQCQRASWIAGHRKYCAQRLKNTQEVALSRKERSFLRALANYDWTQSREHLAESLLCQCLRRRRWDDCSDAVTIFEQTSPDAYFSKVKLYAPERVQAILTSEKHAEDVERVRQSAGRLELHFMQVNRMDGRGDFDELVLLPLPLHCDSVVVPEIARIARELIPYTLNRDWRTIDLRPYLTRLKPLLSRGPGIH